MDKFYHDRICTCDILGNVEHASLVNILFNADFVHILIISTEIALISDISVGCALLISFKQLFKRSFHEEYYDFYLNHLTCKEIDLAINLGNNQIHGNTT